MKQRSKLFFACLSVLIYLIIVECSNSCCQPKATTIKLKNFRNVVYYGTFYIGTPRQKFTALFSTRSSDTWVLSCDCTTASCKAHKRFDSDESSSYDNQGDLFFIDYGEGANITGVTAKEEFKLNDVKICGQGFGLIEDQRGDWSFDPEDAIIGLGLTSYNNTGFLSVLENAFIQGKIGQKVFSFWFNRNPHDSDGGELVLGGINQNRYKGKITYTPLTNTTRWQIELDKVVVKIDGNKKLTVCSGGAQASLQAGGAYIWGPYDEVKKINKALGGKYSSKTGLYHFDCSAQGNLPDIVFYIEGVKFPIKSSAYIMCGEEVGYGQGCFSTLIPVVNQNSWDLGSVFLGEYYSIFDAGRKRVGFACLS